MRRHGPGGARWHVVHRPARAAQPTVVLESPLAAPVEVWNALVRDLGDVGTFAYERAGVGRSTPARTPRTAATLADECLALLDARGVPTVVLVAEGFGGLVALEVARRRPDRVRGLVLVDCPHPAALTRSARQRQGAARLELALVRARLRALLRRPPADDLFDALDAADAPGARDALRATGPATWRTALDELRAWKLTTGRDEPVHLPGDPPVALVTSSALLEGDPSHRVLQEALLEVSARATRHVVPGASASPTTSAAGRRAVRDLVLAMTGAVTPSASVPSAPDPSAPAPSAPDPSAPVPAAARAADAVAREDAA